MLAAATGSIYLTDELVPPLEDSPALEPNAKERARTRPRILIVDDERLIADTMAEILEGAGFHVAVAYNGWGALEVAVRFLPEYLISDVLMPQMNGVDLAIAIRKMCPAARILLFSGQAGITDILLDGKRQGFEFELVAKPIHPLRLIDLLKN